jgi:hypothetical protein
MGRAEYTASLRGYIQWLLNCGNEDAWKFVENLKSFKGSNGFVDITVSGKIILE